MARYYISPHQLMGFVEVGPDTFKSTASMTTDEWRSAEKVETRWRRHVVRQMLKLADVCHVPGDVPLLPYLEALASSGNVTVLH